MNNLERLTFVIEGVGQRMVLVSLDEMNEDGCALLEVAGAYLRGCFEAACGVATLAAFSEYGGLFAAERAAWEMGQELEYLLRCDKPAEGAIKAKVNATLELLEYVEEGDEGTGLKAANELALAAYEARYPLLVAEVRKQRLDRRFHWSGERSRSAVVASPGSKKRLYGMLSWEAHPVMCVIRDVEAVPREGKTVLKFVEADNPKRGMERAAWATGEYLHRAWNDFAAAFGQEPIDFPLPPAP